MSVKFSFKLKKAALQPINFDRTQKVPNFDLIFKNENDEKFNYNFIYRYD